MPDDTRRIPAYCPLCVSRCGCEAVVENGRLVAIEPDPSHPTGKALCAKGRAAPELVDAPDRLLFPLRRTRPKGDPDPGWRRISWDEALDETATALRRIAAEERAGGGGIRRHDGGRHRDLRRDALGQPADQQLRLTEQLQRHRDLLLAPGIRRLPSPPAPGSAHRTMSAPAAFCSGASIRARRGSPPRVPSPRRARAAQSLSSWIRAGSALRSRPTIGCRCGRAPTGRWRCRSPG